MSKSKVLCLHGAHTSGEVFVRLFFRGQHLVELTGCQIFRAQLGQLVPRLEAEQNLELHFIDGLIETEGEEDMRGMFPEPYYSWCSMSSDKKLVNYESVKQALDFVQDIIVEDGPFDGIMGFSQGAALALGLLLRYASEHPLDPAYAICKWAVLFSCVEIDREKTQLDDDSLLSIPSLHVYDQSDSLLGTGGSNVACEPGSAKLILHERGHAIPRDNVTVNRILDAVQDLQHRAMVF
jgi:hypothetical protein